MKRVLCLVCCALAFTAWADGEDKSVERDFDKDHFATGGAVKINQPVTGDLMAAGGNIEVNAPVSGDAMLAGGTLRMNASIAQSLYAAGGQLSINGVIGRNARVAGGQIEFGPTSVVAGNVSIGGGQVTTRGQIKGYLLAAGGKVLIDGVVAGDVEAHSGQLELGPNARIAGKLRYASRAELKRDPAAQVQGAVERVDLAGGWPVPEDVEHGMGRAGGWIWAIGLLIVAGVLVAALPAFYARVTETVRTRFAMSVLLGFVMLVCIPIAAILFFITIIGVPLGLLLIAMYLTLLVIGYVASGIALGEWALMRLKFDRRNSRYWRMGAAALGVLMVGLLARVPWLGGWIVLLALLAGLGALAQQLWHWRERPAMAA
jgi:cytoskeletal protein CcmA (bactofilin family)